MSMKELEIGYKERLANLKIKLDKNRKISITKKLDCKDKIKRKHNKYYNYNKPSIKLEQNLYPPIQRVNQP